MAHANPEDAKKYNREWYIKNRKNNPDFKKWKKEYDYNFHKGYKNPNLTSEKNKSHAKKYRDSHQEEIRKKDREMKKKYYEKYKAQHKIWLKKNPEKEKEYRKKYRDSGKSNESRIKYRYGISKEEFNLILEKQNHICPICGESFDLRKKYIDHDHSTKKVRGIVHMQCNTLMGLAKDNPQILENAATYLRNSKETK